MPLKVRIQNCQSIEDATLEVDGFTLITGENNSGKTATQRAIRGAFTNAPAGPLVRYGEDHVTVDIEFDDGQTLKWEKGGKLNQYTVNGVRLEKVGRGVPDEVKALGVMPLTVGDETMWPQIATQFPSTQFQGQVFLLDKSGALLAEIVADVERIGKLSQGLKLCEKDRRAARDKLGVRREDKLGYEEELAEFTGLDSVVTQIDSLDTMLEEAADTQAQVELLEEFQEAYQAAVEIVTKLEGIGEVAIPSAAVVEQARTAGQDLREVSALAEKLSTTTAQVESLKGLAQVKVPAASLAAEAQGTAQKLAELLKLQGTWETITRKVADATQGAEAADRVSLFEKDDPRLKKLQKIQKGLGLLEDMRSRLVKARADEKKASEALAGFEGSVRSAEDELKAILGSMEQCPTCKTPMSETHVGHLGAA